ncbi:MAG: Unknown protein [uncultured Sulfurovum sp.]|uniref:Uncharacterized protein n=1 Tax=uncultured Sulfurovum sp. TaxID=269237 RepID=A0A6S6SJM9_9BACT|nr:MAG: Unknown protein [uncultured Sulfurovum sp.]
MAKFIILFFLITGGAVSYFTYTGAGQERLETLEKENIHRTGSSSSSSVRSNSYRTGNSSGWSGGSSYNSGGYSYGK